MFTFSPLAPGDYTDVSSFVISETGSPADGEEFLVNLSGTGVDCSNDGGCLSAI